MKNPTTLCAATLTSVPGVSEQPGSGIARTPVGTPAPTPTLQLHRVAVAERAAVFGGFCKEPGKAAQTAL